MIHRHKRAWLLATSGVASALVLSGALVACGGGTSAVQTGTSAKAAIVQPNGSPSTTQEACTDPVDFARISGSLGEIGLEKALVNRHVDCRVATTDAIEVKAQLALKDGVYSYLDANTPPDAYVNSYTVGTIVVSTKLTSYGPSTVLSKKYQFELTVDSFTPDSSYPGPIKRPAILMQPVLDCITNFYTAVPNSGTCTPDQLPQVRVSPDGAPATSSFVVNFNWTKSEGEAHDLEAFLVRLERINFAVDGGFGLQLPSNSSPDYFDPKVTSYPSKLRCDRGVAQVDKSGCVYEEAAAVYVLRLDDPAVSEAAEHIKYAQAGGVPPADPNGPPNSGQLAPSPGKFLLKPGSRALPDDSVTGGGLQRLKDDEGVAKLNRSASCKLSTALIAVRNPEPSASCKTDLSNCECDEYPFASTWNGGYFAPDSTSVRRINKAQNNAAGGGTLTQWYLRERVIDLTVYPPDGSVPSPGGGDRFWVHVPEQ